MYQPSQAWDGRNDGQRWHHLVKETGELAVIGFASDEGVRRNLGRPGAACAPDKLRAALGALAVHGTPRSLKDYGDVVVSDQDLEAGQTRLATLVASTVHHHPLTLVLGGGHETAYGSHCGLRRGLPSQHPVGIINVDAHFDLRQAQEATSGTPFYQICQEFHCGADYTVLGISRPNNTSELFAIADSLGASYWEEDHLNNSSLKEITDILRERINDVDSLHLSIDLDVLSAAVAPGVSAPATIGLDLHKVRHIITSVAASGKLRLVDVVELNPRFDIDDRTAKVAARLLWEVVNSLPVQ
ncbi:formimidoylglutamase [Corynebacterium poyangense]|uniref:Formimidoylglutamase n=1 Tax=Corynebacterium poyangense TaxID=2684405 RepID=A0A7H0SLD5_9CORY|nr:formimidoylglutamase [Corynebacterium poyangense]MBZ8177452.1 formimidoylglutamase [Corynebacterium poyangense]QNQ89360.1 formimidoylglutamase [Corynebacterium poyangense]